MPVCFSMLFYAGETTFNIKRRKLHQAKPVNCKEQKTLFIFLYQVRETFRS